MTGPESNPLPARSSNRIESFRNAFRGWWTFFGETPNARIHLAFAAGATAAGVWFGFTRVEWAVLWVTIGLVITAEFFNSAVEAVVDLASPEVHPLAKTAKDVAAGGVLFAAFAAVIVGLILFGPPLAVRLFPSLTSLFY